MVIEPDIFPDVKMLQAPVGDTLKQSARVPNSQVNFVHSPCFVKGFHQRREARISTSGVHVSPPSSTVAKSFDE